MTNTTLRRIIALHGKGWLVAFAAAGALTIIGNFAALGAERKGDRVVIGGRPAGCPARYCGCGLRKYLGIPDARLNLAWNWARLFPRTSPQPGAAAVRRGHVMLLVSHVAGSRYLVRDYNGGRGLSWIHVRDVRGFVFVDPRTRIAEGRQ